MTHDELVQRAKKWLRNTRRCSVVISELVTGCPEIPDAIGWGNAGFSVLVECKTSVSDFYADRRKRFDRCGFKRYYMTIPGLIKPSLLRDGWGLLEVHPRQVKVVHEAVQQDDRNMRHELSLLVSALRRGASCPPESLVVVSSLQEWENQPVIEDEAAEAARAKGGA